MKTFLKGLVLAAILLGIDISNFQENREMKQMLNCIDMLKLDEGFKTKVYKDSKGNHTVGIGFNMDDPHARGTWIRADIPESFISVYNGTQELSDESAKRLLAICLLDTKKDVATIFTLLPTYPYNIQLALTNLMFNLGKPKFLTFKTFISLIAKENFSGAADDLKNTAWYSEVGDRGDRVVALLNNNDGLYA